MGEFIPYRFELYIGGVQTAKMIILFIPELGHRFDPGKLENHIIIPTFYSNIFLYKAANLK